MGIEGSAGMDREPRTARFMSATNSLQVSLSYIREVNPTFSTSTPKRAVFRKNSAAEALKQRNRFSKVSVGQTKSLPCRKFMTTIVGSEFILAAELRAVGRKGLHLDVLACGRRY